MANPQREHPNTYIVADRSSQDELNRLQLQDHLITTAMGGVLPEQPDPGRFHRVLDVGCGTGDWLIEAAQTYPTMTELVGVDISGSLLDFARAQADARSVADRVTFRTMDALRMLEFPASSFDLVNMRYRHLATPHSLGQDKLINIADNRVIKDDMVEEKECRYDLREKS